MSSDRSSESIPVFPLSNVVLFPGILIRLYIFEPRYRQMTRHALDGGKRIGMVVVIPAHMDEIQAEPPIFPIGCEGLITRCQEQQDGSFNIALLGTQRFEIREELEPNSDTLFRRARVRRLEDPLPASDRGRVAVLRSQVFEQMRLLVARRADDAVRADSSASGGMDDATLVNTLCLSLDFTASEKQGLLEADSISRRFQGLSELLRFRLAVSESEGQSGPQILH